MEGHNDDDLVDYYRHGVHRLRSSSDGPDTDLESQFFEGPLLPLDTKVASDCGCSNVEKSAARRKGKSPIWMEGNSLDWYGSCETPICSERRVENTCGTDLIGVRVNVTREIFQLTPDPDVDPWVQGEVWQHFTHAVTGEANYMVDR
ncbi:hypothetical protein M758_UG003800 [Ceratodon purpureus]|nr:hypothetical protein M758_UG003800 [Ceratodon purpureus]